MKKVKYILVFIVALALPVLMGAVLDTQRDGWSYPQDANGTDDTLVSAGVTTMKYANVPSARYEPRSRHNAIQCAWRMQADGQSCVAYLFAARTRGDIVLVWTATLTAGKQAATGSGFYVDTIASVTDNWGSGVGEIDIAGADRMSRIELDTEGYKYFFFQYTGLSSESIQAQYSGY